MVLQGTGGGGRRKSVFGRGGGEECVWEGVGVCVCLGGCGSVGVFGRVWECR